MNGEKEKNLWQELVGRMTAYELRKHLSDVNQQSHSDDVVLRRKLVEDEIARRLDEYDARVANNELMKNQFATAAAGLAACLWRMFKNRAITEVEREALEKDLREFFEKAG